MVPRLKQSGFQIVTNAPPNICYVWPYWLSYAEGSPFRDIRVMISFYEDFSSIDLA